MFGKIRFGMVRQGNHVHGKVRWGAVGCGAVWQGKVHVYLVRSGGAVSG